MFKKFWHILFPQYAGTHFDTVRYAFPLVVIATLFAGLASVISENSSYITIKSDTTTVTRDQDFFIDVSVTTHIAVNALDLTISYPEDKIKIMGIDTGTSVITLWTEEPYAKDGTVYLRGGTFRKGFIGEHSVARIRAQAIEAGNAKIFVSNSELIAGDGKGSAVSMTESADDTEVKIAVLGTEDGIITGKAAIALITDTDGDGDVDLGDISTFMAAWFMRNKTFDFNGDGRMTFKDFSILLADSFAS